MATEDGNAKRELVLPAGEYALIMDMSKGTVSVAVGPHQKSLTANSEVTMSLDPETDRLVQCSIGDSTRRFTTAKQGQYVILENPAPEGRTPQIGAMTATIDLNMGFRVNLPGPTTFPLWPMQRAKVIDAHILRTDQYLVVSIVDEAGATANKGKGFTYRAKSEPEAEGPLEQDHPITLGHRFIVRGTEVSCYIPPTGYEVIPEVVDGKTSYELTAVSLERLEYCTLLDEGGGCRIEKGPAVVFPSPTETFVAETAPDGTKITKFKAIELDNVKGIHVKVTEDYIEDDGTQRKEGDELFITGSDQRIYFPRREHSIIRYGQKSIITYGISIPVGEGRYVLDRIVGGVTLVEGPQTFLPNPIHQVITRRALTATEVRLFYPGNSEVEAVNRVLRDQSTENLGDPDEYLKPEKGEDRGGYRSRALVSETVGGGTSSFDRGTSYTPPRTVILNSKFEGAVKIDVWPGFAIMVTNGKGDRKVVVGPSRTLLQYDETLHRFSLSTGTPKTDDRLVEGVYLQVIANTVSDEVVVETIDLCKLKLTVSYRVNFEGDSKERWFNVSNYVALLTSTLRSMLRKVAKQHRITEFLSKAADIVRDAILGAQVPGGERVGRVFRENGMRVYDMDVLSVEVCDREISRIIGSEQLAVFNHELELAGCTRQRETALAKAETEKMEIETRLQVLSLQLQAKESELKQNAQIQKLQIESTAGNKALEEKLRQERAVLEMATQQKIADIEVEIDETKIKLEELRNTIDVVDLKQRTDIEVAAYKAQMEALGDKLPEALIHLGNNSLMEAMSRNLSVQTMLGGNNLAEVFQNAVGKGQLGDIAKRLFAPEEAR